MKKSQINDVISKLNQCDDAVIKLQAEQLLASANGKSKIQASKIVNKAELLLDSVNSAQCKYSTLYDACTPIGTYNNYSRLARNVSANELKKLIEKGDKEKAEKIYRKIEEGYSEARKVSKFTKRHDITASYEILENEAKFQNLKQFIKLHPEDKETATYLWKKYFVTTQEIGSQRILNDIYNEFGTQIFANGSLDKSVLVNLREELLQFKKVLGEKFVSPRLLDIKVDNIDYHMMSSGAKGFESQGCIVIGDEALEHIKYTWKYNRDYATILRHELAHLQDKAVTTLSQKAYKNAKPLSTSDFDILELNNAGIRNTEYFFSNDIEAKAVFVQGNMSKYSDAFKHKMIHEIKGLPEEIVNLKDVSRTKCALLGEFYGRQNYKIIDQLEEVLEGGISEDVVNIIADNPGYIKLIKSICKKVPKGTKLSQKNFIKIFENRIERQREYLAKAKDTDIFSIECSEPRFKFIFV